MAQQTSIGPRAVVDKARGLVARTRASGTEARRSLPIRRAAEEIRALWDEPGTRAAVLEGIPVADASLDIGSEVGDWGTTVTVKLRLHSPVPRMARQALAGKAVRRLKALAETGEVPTTERNPSARADAGKETA